MATRTEVEFMLKAVTGGQEPTRHSTLLRTDRGWIFSALPEIEVSTSTPGSDWRPEKVGSLWLQTDKNSTRVTRTWVWNGTKAIPWS